MEKNFILVRYPEVGHVIANLISYALIRDKYRKYKKSLK